MNIAKILYQIRNWKAHCMLSKAQSLEEFRTMLLAAFGDLPDDKLATVLAGAMTTAEAAGRFDLHEQSIGEIK